MLKEKYKAHLKWNQKRTIKILKCFSHNNHLYLPKKLTNVIHYISLSLLFNMLFESIYKFS